jgi:heme A synthase
VLAMQGSEAAPARPAGGRGASVSRERTASFRRWAWWTAAATLVLLALGAATLAWGAGLACPDWPLCRGRVVPAMTGGVVLEWSHRFVVTVVAALTLAAAVVAVRARVPRGTLVGVLAAVALLGVQAALGALTIFDRLDPAVVMLHAAVGTAFFVLWVCLGVAAGRRPLAGPSPGAVGRGLPWIAAAAAYLTLLLGSGSAGSGGGLACPLWPACGVPGAVSGGGLATLQVAHRLSAALTLALVAWATVALRRLPGPSRAAWWAFALLGVQVLLGAAVVLGRLAPALVVAHFVVAAALVAIMAGTGVAAVAVP